MYIKLGEFVIGKITKGSISSGQRAATLDFSVDVRGASTLEMKPHLAIPNETNIDAMIIDDSLKNRKK